MPNLTVRQMFTAMAGLVLVLVLLIGGVGQYSASRLEHAVDHATHSSAVQRTQMDADMMHDAIRSDVLSYLLAAGDAARRQAATRDLAQHAARLRKDAGEIAGADLQTATRQQVEKVRPVLERYLASAQAIVQGGGQTTTVFEQDFELLETEMEQLSDLIQAETDSSHGEADAALSANRWGSGGVIAAVLLILALAVPFMIRRIVHPLAALADVARTIRAGSDLTLRAPQTADNEIGQTITAFNALLDSLQAIVREVRSSSVQISDRSQSLAGASSQTTAASERQSEASSSIAAAVEELSVSIDQMSDRSGVASAASAQSGDYSREGVRVVENTASEMRQIAEAVRTSSRAIEALGQNAEQISRIVGVIRDIADQTNLLALNAAIEAARAGEQGRGFAVVADEVRKLAERTGKSTQEISAMINDMQTSTRNAVSTMNDGVQRVEMGVELAGQAGRTIAQVANNAGSAAEAVGDITHALREQNAAGQEIARRVEQVAQLAEESHAAAQASARHADELARLAVALDATVGRFKV